MHPILFTMGVSAMIMLILMGLLWLIHFPIRNAGILDFGWALGLVLLAGYYALTSNGYLARRELLIGMVGFWGLRLAYHVLFDRVIGKPEDPRYTAFRRSWGTHVELRLFSFFQLQALLNVFLAVPFLLIARNPDPALHGLEWLGLSLWVVAMSGEWLADEQLKTFKAVPSNRGKTCRSGLWNYSRHPNYFFEWLIWVAYWITACASPYGWITLFCPILMLYFLIYVTGIAATETHALQTRGDEYREYQRTTSAFVPWLKKA